MKTDIRKLCECYNNARTQNAGRKGGSEWVLNILKSFGISGYMAQRILKESTLLTPYKREHCGKGNYKGYIFPTTPVHITWFQNWLSPKASVKVKKDTDFETECVEYLKEQGYSLKRCVGFDEEAFASDYPELYQKYLRYEEI